MTQEEINKAFEEIWPLQEYRIDNLGLQPGTYILNESDITHLYNVVKNLCQDFFEIGIEVGTEPKQNNTEIRGNNFWLTVRTPENIQKYGEQMLLDFFEYWSEPNTSHTKMRFELQKTWDINRRLARWARNNFNGNSNGNNKPTIEQQRLDKLASILAG